MSVKGPPSSLPPSSKNLNQLYILVVCVLMLVQDSAVLQEIVKHEHEVPMDWYKERQLKHVSQIKLKFKYVESFRKITGRVIAGITSGRHTVVPAAHSDARAVPSAGPVLAL